MMIVGENTRETDRFADIGRDTATLLHLQWVLPCLLFALLFCMLAFATSYALGELGAFVTIRLSDPSYAIVLAEMVLALVLLFSVLSGVMPLWLGKLRMAGLLWQGKVPEQKEIFYYFTSRSRYFRAWRTGALTTLLLLLPVTAVAALFSGVANVYHSILTVYFTGPVAVLLCIVLAILAIAIGVAVWFFSGTHLAFAAVAVGNERLKLRQCFLLAARAGKRHIMEIFAFSLKSFLWLVLSLLTVGVLYVLWFSHYYNLSYMRLSMALCPKEEV